MTLAVFCDLSLPLFLIPKGTGLGGPGQRISTTLWGATEILGKCPGEPGGWRWGGEDPDLTSASSPKFGPYLLSPLQISLEGSFLYFERDTLGYSHCTPSKVPSAGGPGPNQDLAKAFVWLWVPQLLWRHVSLSQRPEDRDRAWSQESWCYQCGLQDGATEPCRECDFQRKFSKSLRKWLEAGELSEMQPASAYLHGWWLKQDPTCSLHSSGLKPAPL